MTRGNRPFLTIAFFAVSTTAAALFLFCPRPSRAEEIADYERTGEADEDGMKFGNVVVKGELVASPTAPGGWVLLRTLENKGEDREKVTLEERVTRTETMPDARVTPAAKSLVVRTQVFALGPHEKRSIGVHLPKGIGEQITAGEKARKWAEAARERALAAERFDSPDLELTYMDFAVEYLTPRPARPRRPRSMGTS